MVDEQINGQLPHTNIPLSQLGSNSRWPDVSEMQAVCRLHKVAVALELRFVASEYAFPRNDQMEATQTPEPAEHMDEWTGGMHRAIYRSLIASAALVSVYFEPCLAAQLSTDLEVRRLVTTQRISDTQRAFLRQFTAYNPWLDDDLDHAVFGNIGDWLIHNILADVELRVAMEKSFSKNTGRGLSCSKRRRYDLKLNEATELTPGPEPCAVHLDGYSHADAHFVALEVMRMLWACGNITKHVHYGGSFSELPILEVSYSPIILRDWYTPARVSFTASLVNQTPLFKPQLHIHLLSKCAQENSIWFLMDQAKPRPGSRVDLERQGIYMPCLQFKFFLYFLHHHLQATFHPLFFQEEDSNDVLNNWGYFQQDLGIFASDQVPGRRTYYPNPDVFPEEGILDGADLLVDSVPLRAQISLIFNLSTTY